MSRYDAKGCLAQYLSRNDSGKLLASYRLQVVSQGGLRIAVAVATAVGRKLIENFSHMGLNNASFWLGAEIEDWQKIFLSKKILIVIIQQKSGKRTLGVVISIMQ